MFFSYLCTYWGHVNDLHVYIIFFYMHVNLAGMMNYFFDSFLLWDFIFYCCIWYSWANMNWCIFVIMCHIQISCQSQYLMKCFLCFSIVISLTFSHDVLCLHLFTVQQPCYQSTLYHCCFGVFLFDACMWDISIFLILPLSSKGFTRFVCFYKNEVKNA